MAADRIGLGWRGELAAGILSNLAQIDVLEVIADDYYRASRASMDALCSLARQWVQLGHIRVDGQRQGADAENGGQQRHVGAAVACLQA